MSPFFISIACASDSLSLFLSPKAGRGKKLQSPSFFRGDLREKSFSQRFQICREVPESLNTPSYKTVETPLAEVKEIEDWVTRSQALKHIFFTQKMCMRAVHRLDVSGKDYTRRILLKI